MVRTFALAIASIVLGSTTTLAQNAATKAAEPSKPLPMPADRAAASYSIYSSLIPLGETSGKDWPHAMWLVQDTTITAIPPDEPCQGKPGATHFESSMNPHLGVHPPDDQREDLNEVLTDFDLHCHDRLTLDSHKWTISQPVHLLNPQQQKDFRINRAGEPKDPVIAAKYKGAPALYGFSEVYFNVHHTVALVYATHWCGNLCGQGFWLAFGLKDGKWLPLPWQSASWIS